MWRNAFYKLMGMLLEAVGSAKAYKVTAIGALTQQEAMRRAQSENTAHASLQAAPMPGVVSPADASYANIPGAGQYANNPSPYGVAIRAS